MKKLLKKISLFFLSFLILISSYLTILAPSVHAQSTWYNQPFVEWYTKVYDTSNPSEIFGERYTAAQVQWVVWGLLSMPLNFLGKDNQEYLNCVLKYVGDQQINVGECAKGVLQALINIVKFITPNVLGSSEQESLFSRIFDSNRPVSGIGYVKKLINKFSVVEEVHAQSQPGFGFSHLTLIIPYWSASRNIAYSIAVIAVIVFAFMIMFRVKISPQAVITIQSALPKVIIALILATFSLAIAGLMIDLIYVISGIFATLLSASGIASTAGRAYTTIVGDFSIKGFSLGNLLGGPITIFFVMFFYLVLFFVSVVWNALTSILLSLSLITGTGFTIVGIALTIWLIVLMFIYAIKIPWVLFKTTINIYLSIIVAPLQIMLGTLMPQVGFGLWFKNLLANILVFPLTGVLIFLAYDFLMFSYTAGSVVGADGLLSAINEVFGTHLGGGISDVRLWSPPYLGGDISGFIFLMISFGIIVLIPKVPELMKSLIMGEKFSFGTAIGEAYGPIRPVVGMATGMASQTAQRSALIPMLNWSRANLAEGNVIRKGLEGWAREQKMAPDLRRSRVKSVGEAKGG